MKTFKILFIALATLIMTSCSEELMDLINRDVNNALTMSAQSELPDVILNSAFSTTGTDIAWYATVYIEHSAGTWAQSAQADKRVGQTASTLFNNSWNAIYDNLMVLDDMIKKTDPSTGDEDNLYARGIAQILTAYNLAVLTDMWGEVPWSEAIKGAEILQPRYDKQSTIYPKIMQYLDDGIASINAATNISVVGDYIYGGSAATAKSKWIKAANSLKARYSLRLSKVDPASATKALAAIPNGFTSNADNLWFAKYEATATGKSLVSVPCRQDAPLSEPDIVQHYGGPQRSKDPCIFPSGRRSVQSCSKWYSHGVAGWYLFNFKTDGKRTYSPNANDDLP
jgi:hypothetical protein